MDELVKPVSYPRLPRATLCAHRLYTQTLEHLDSTSTLEKTSFFLPGSGSPSRPSVSSVSSSSHSDEVEHWGSKRGEIVKAFVVLSEEYKEKLDRGNEEGVQMLVSEIQVSSLSFASPLDS